MGTKRRRRRGGAAKRGIRNEGKSRYEMSTEDEELQGEGSGREELQGEVYVSSKQLCTFKLCGDNIDKSVK